MRDLPKSETRLFESEARRIFWFELANLAAFVRMLHSVKLGTLPQAAERPEVDVPLDGAETKSEDCQRDVGRNGLLKLERPPQIACSN